MVPVPLTVKSAIPAAAFLSISVFDTVMVPVATALELKVTVALSVKLVNETLPETVIVPAEIFLLTSTIPLFPVNVTPFAEVTLTLDVLSALFTVADPFWTTTVSLSARVNAPAFIPTA